MREYGFHPRNKTTVEDGSVLPRKYEPFPENMYGLPLEEIDTFIYEEVTHHLALAGWVEKRDRLTTNEWYVQNDTLNISPNVYVSDILRGFQALQKELYSSIYGHKESVSVRTMESYQKTLRVHSYQSIFRLCRNGHHIS